MGGVKLTKFLKYTYKAIAAVIVSAAAVVYSRFQSRRATHWKNLMSGGGCAAGTCPLSGIAAVVPAFLSGSVVLSYAPPSGSDVVSSPPSAAVKSVSAAVVGVSALIGGSSAPVSVISAIVLGSPALVGGLSALVGGSPAPVVGSSALVEKSSAVVSVISTPNEKVLTESKEILNAFQIQYINSKNIQLKSIY